MTLRRRLVAALAAAMALAGPGKALADEPAAPSAPKVLRVAFRAAETTFDPAQVNDLYSRTVTSHIFEGLYSYDHLARPYKLKPAVADGMPVASADFKVWTIKLKRGIYFADDPAFKGQRREVTAQDFVYAIKRFYDPAFKSPVYPSLQERGILGLDALRNESLQRKTPFDYDRPVEGLQATDRYTLQFKLDKPQPRLTYMLADGSLFGAVAREVVEHYRAEIGSHPVGSGPFVLKQWRRSSRIVLDRNPGYREQTYDAEPAADDAEGQAILHSLKGRRLPMIDRVEIAVIEEGQPRWLSFLNGEFDVIDPVPPELALVAVPGGQLAPNLAKRGIRLHRVINADVTLTYFNMEDPVVGGYTPEKVALRRAIGLGMDIAQEINLVRNGQAIPAQAGIPPGLYGYDAQLRTVNSEYDPSRAKALLDLYGYVDRNGDGWREQPDGSPLIIRKNTQADQLYRQLDGLWQKNLAAIGIKGELVTQQWPENLKAARAGKLMVWSLGYTSASPDGLEAFQRVYGPAAGGQNLSRFKLEALDRLYERMNQLPDGPERLGLTLEGNKLVAAYMPYKPQVHRIYVDLSQPWLVGYRRPIFWLEQWKYLDVDTRAAK